jgi:hypothetical protein
MIFFVPSEQVVHVQVPPARTTLPQRFDQFRSLRLTEPLAPEAAPPARRPQNSVMASATPGIVRACIRQIPLIDTNCRGELQRREGSKVPRPEADIAVRTSAYGFFPSTESWRGLRRVGVGVGRPGRSIELPGGLLMYPERRSRAGAIATLFDYNPRPACHAHTLRNQW